VRTSNSAYSGYPELYCFIVSSLIERILGITENYSHGHLLYQHRTSLISLILISWDFDAVCGSGAKSCCLQFDTNTNMIGDYYHYVIDRMVKHCGFNRYIKSAVVLLIPYQGLYHAWRLRFRQFSEKRFKTCIGRLFSCRFPLHVYTSTRIILHLHRVVARDISSGDY
jgi:hypothetical protein